jgi:DNA-binding SARP family transcriptional activator/predicted negative regulator of RcsB-dependent stress response
MEFQVLGPVQVLRDGVPIYVATAPKPRLLLAVLLANPGQALSVDKLINALWGEVPPSSARQNLQQYIHRLRLALGSSALPHRSSGYGLSLEIDVDSTRFLQLARDGSSALEKGEYENAARHLWEGINLWRGDAFADVADCELVRNAAATLEKARTTATEHWAEAKMFIGQAREVPSILAGCIERDPLNENTRALLMRSLAASGRQAEALQLYRETRAMLVEQLGIEPGSTMREVHESILRDCGASQLPPIIQAKELPANVAGFVGREDALSELDFMLPSDRDDPAGPVIISAIAGTAGVGKTALAVRWSHRVAARFPDGQLHINLNGYSNADPMTPMAALSSLLGSLGVKPNDVPSDVQSAAARYRTLLSGRRVLILLDNARSAEQVRPLLPGSPGCLVLVTSRDRLSGLVANEGARRLNLDTLSAAEAVALLEHLLGTQRVAAETQAVEDLARLCAYLPLALRIAAARLADQPRLAIQDYVSALQQQNPAAALSTDEGAVRTAFQLSYKALSPMARRAFRRLGLLPTQNFTCGAVGRLAGVGEQEAAELLEQLASAHLATQDYVGRYSMHDLLRQYASLVTTAEDSEDERMAAIGSLYGWYLAKIHAAGDQVHPHIVRLPSPRHSVEEFDGPQAAIGWLDLERQNFRLLIMYAMRHGPKSMVWRLADGLRGYYEQIRHTAERLNIARMAVAAARSVDDPSGQAAGLLSLAHACFGAGRHKSAVRHLELAAMYAHRAHWTEGEAAIRGNLASVLVVLGQASAAVESAKVSISLYALDGNLLGEAKARECLANCYRILGWLPDGVTEANRALEQFAKLGSRHGAAMIHECLGELHLDLGDLEIALSHLQQSLVIHTELQAPFRVAVARLGIAKIHLGRAELSEARTEAATAQASLHDLRDLRLGAKATNILGEIALTSGDDATASACHHQALQDSLNTNASGQIIEARLGLGAVYLIRGEVGAALDQARLAVRLSQDAGYRVSEGQALNLCAAAKLGQGNADAARDFAVRALAVNGETGHLPGENRSRELIAKCDLALAVVGELEGDPEVSAFE